MTALIVGVAAVLLLAAAACAVTLCVNRRYPATGEFLPVTGGRLHAVMRGEQSLPVIVLIHGASGSQADQLVALGRRLEAQYRVVSIDRPGQGWSSRPGGRAAASPVGQARLIHEALRRAGIARAILVGHSLGAAVAAGLTLEAPAFVRGLVLVAPATHPWPGGVAWHYHAAAAPGIGLLFSALVVPLAGCAMLPGGVRSVFRPQPPPSGYARRTAAALAITPLRFRANAQDIVGLNAELARLSRRYRAITAPTAIVTGDRDGTVWSNLHSLGLAQAIEGSSLAVLPGIGHMPHHVATDAVINAVAEVGRRGA